VQAAIGEEYTVEHLTHIGERIWNMERDFNNNAGFTHKLTTACPSACLTEPAKTGPRQRQSQHVARDVAQVL
jgi:aldehyde:ferredoxin oxidoreductase